MNYCFLITPHKGKPFEKKIKSNDEHTARRALILECLKRQIQVKTIQTTEDAK